MSQTLNRLTFKLIMHPIMSFLIKMLLFIRVAAEIIFYKFINKQTSEHLRQINLIKLNSNYQDFYSMIVFQK